MELSTRFLARLTVLGIALAIPGMASAGLMLIPITNFSIGNPGETALRRLDDGRLLVTTRGVTGQAFVDCADDAHCHAAGLHNQPVGLALNLRLVLDPTGTTLDGRVGGGLTFPPAGIVLPDSAKFAGEAHGRSQCQRGTPPACATAMRAAVTLDDEVDDSLLGIIELAVTGTLTRSAGSATWEDLTVAGDLAVLVP